MCRWVDSVKSWFRYSNMDEAKFSTLANNHAENRIPGGFYNEFRNGIPEMTNEKFTEEELAMLEALDDQLIEPDVSDICDYTQMTVRDLIRLRTAKKEAVLEIHQALFPRSNVAYDADNIRRAAQDELKRRGM